MVSTFAKIVYDTLSRVPVGRVTTYGDLAAAAGFPGAARAVGSVLNKNPFAPQVPCHRVVRADGSLGGFAGGPAKKIRLLQSEGVAVKKGKIRDFSLVKYQF